MSESHKHSDDVLRIGASWYPECWPEDTWADDVARMRELGFNIVRLFEFAWHRLEPEEGEYDFDWALKVMDLCHQAGIAVMVGTPTAAPPAWLTSTYPDVLRVDAQGKTAVHGKRRHYSPFSRTYRGLSAGIVQRMVEAFADHPALHSWQIDNEISGKDYGVEAHQYFRNWLRTRYGDIESLNRTWGLEFWSQAYDRFEQIPMPVASVGSIEVPERHHPSLIMAVARCTNDAWTEYIRLQAEIIRSKSDKPITTNMTSGLGMHWFQHNRLLDRVGHSLYKDVDHYPWNLMYFDRMRAEKHNAPYWLLETAPNWSGGGKQWNIHHSAAGLRAMSWMSTLLGGNMVLYWQWRSHWAGQEMQHGTCVSATGQWRPNKDAWRQLAHDFREESEWLGQHPPAQAQVAIVLSNEAAWAFSIDPIDDDMQYTTRWRDDYYLPLERRHIWRDVVHESADLSRYKVLLIPMMPMLSLESRHRIAEWVEHGGRLLIGPLTGYRSEEFTAFTDQTFGGLEELIGADGALGFSAHWQEDVVNVEVDGIGSTRTRNWCEAFTPTTGEAIAYYRGGYGDGQIAAVRAKRKNGTVITLGCHVDQETYAALVRQLMDEVDLAPLAEGSEDVTVVPRGGSAAAPAAYGLVNLVEQPRSITLPAGGTDRLSGQAAGPEVELPPLGVMIVETG